MAGQYLTLADGSVPDGVGLDAMIKAGVLMVRPSQPPAVKDGEHAEDTADPTPDGRGGWVQRWAVVTVPTAADTSAATRQARRDVGKLIAGASADPMGVVVRAIGSATRKQINALRVLPAVGLNAITPAQWAALVAAEIDAGSGD